MDILVYGFGTFGAALDPSSELPSPPLFCMILRKNDLWVDIPRWFLLDMLTRTPVSVSFQVHIKLDYQAHVVQVATYGLGISHC